MAGNLKNLALALLAICVLGAVAAQGAAAVSEDFHFDGEKAVVTGKSAGSEKLKFGGATVACSKASFQGTAVGVKTEENQWKSDQITIKPSYGKEGSVPSECTVGSFEAHIKMNHCAYVYDTDTSPSGHAALEIECSEGNKIEVDITNLCTLKIGPQEVPKAVHYAQKNGSTIEVLATAENIAVEKEKSTANQNACVLFPTVASYTGVSEFECFRDESLQQLEGTSRTTPSGTVEGPTTECSYPEFVRSIFTGKNETGTKDKLKVGAVASLECSSSEFEATADGNAEEEEIPSELTIKPTYGNESGTPSECVFAEELEAHVRTNDCAYVFGSGTNGEGHAPFEIECAEGHKIEIDVTGICTLKIPGQKVATGGVHYENESGVVTASLTAEKVKVEKEKTTEGQTACALIPTGEVGTLTGTLELECFEDKGGPQLNPTTPEATTEGAATECSHPDG